MKGPLILGMAVIYALVAGDFFVSSRWGMGIAFAGYAIGNIGLWLES